MYSKLASLQTILFVLHLRNIIILCMYQLVKHSLEDSKRKDTCERVRGPELVWPENRRSNLRQLRFHTWLKAQEVMQIIQMYLKWGEMKSLRIMDWIGFGLLRTVLSLRIYRLFPAIRHSFFIIIYRRFRHSFFLLLFRF